MHIEAGEEDDRRDMERLAGGEENALDRLMERHGLRLFHFLIRQLHDEEEAADLAQETFVRVFQHCARYQPEYRFSTWLFTIAANLARDRQRWKSRHPQVSLEGPPDDADSVSRWRDRWPAPDAHPADQALSHERARAVQEAVAALPEDLRLPLILAEYEERSQREIAAILGCSPKAVEMRIYRARQHLRQRLQSFLSS
jgi:RNA polymerase sigma-70 factor, ECF subfamily